MVEVTFRFTPPRLDHSKVPLAVARGINEAGDKVRTRVMRQLKVQTGVKNYRSITSRVRTIRAHPGGLRYEILAPLRPLPLTEFPVEVTSKGVDAKTWGVDHLFKRSFALAGNRFVARTGAARFPIHRLLGPNLGRELHQGEVAAVFGHASAEFVAPLVMKHIQKALG